MNFRNSGLLSIGKDACRALRSFESSMTLTLWPGWGLPVYLCWGHDMRLGEIEIAYTLMGQAPENAWFKSGKVYVMRVWLEAYLVTSSNGVSSLI